MQRYVRTTLLLGLLVLAVAPALVQAQALRPEKTLYIKPRVGIAWHLGDTEKSPFNFNNDNWKVDGKIPYAAGLELGYQFNQVTSLSLGWQLTNHPLVYHYGDVMPNNVEDEGTTFNVAQLLLRFQGKSRVAPFVGVGGHVGFSGGDNSDTYFGPSVGLGLDVVLSDRLSLVLENISNLTFGDDAFDGFEESPGGGGDFAPFDVQSALTLGLKVNFKSAFTPVQVMSLNCPGTLQAGTAGTFTATTNDAEATQPVEYRWDFGDASNGTGLSATHTYTEAGNYTVTFTATNRGSTASQTCAVQVTPPPVAEITSLTASPQTFDACEPTTVQFNAATRGSEPITYSWNFGDGTTGTGANPTHTYSQAGTYTVTLTVTNQWGSNNQTITITANPCSACQDITELNSVYFDANSSTLTDEGRAALQENIEVLRECPTICVRLEGWAAPGERNAQALSEARARAVEQFYIDNGVSGSRLLAVGMGRVTGTTSKKEGASQYRRVDSIPMACDLMGSK